MSFFASGETTVETTHASALIFHDEDFFLEQEVKPHQRFVIHARVKKRDEWDITDSACLLGDEQKNIHV